MAQAVHAAVECALDYPDEVRGAPVAVVLGVPDELRLGTLYDTLRGEGYLPAGYWDADLDGQLTALAVVAGRRVPELHRLDLLLRKEVRR